MHGLALQAINYYTLSIGCTEYKKPFYLIIL